MGARSRSNGCQASGSSVGERADDESVDDDRRRPVEALLEHRREGEGGRRLGLTEVTREDDDAAVRERLVREQRVLLVITPEKPPEQWTRWQR